MADTIKGHPKELEDALKLMSGTTTDVADDTSDDDELDTDLVEEDDTEDDTSDETVDEKETETEGESVVDETTDEKPVEDDSEDLTPEKALAKANRERARHARRAQEWKQIAVNSVIGTSLADAGYSGNPEKALKLLDLELIKLSNGKITGIAEQITQLKQDFPQLFTEVKPKSKVVTRKPNTKVETTTTKAPSGDPSIDALMKQAGFK